MLKIRLQRTGRRNEPTFRFVVTEKEKGTKSGGFIEVLGAYDSRQEKSVIGLKKDRVEHWISVGAQPSDTVHNILISEGIIKGKKINVLPRKSPQKSEETTEAPSTETKDSIAKEAPLKEDVKEVAKEEVAPVEKSAEKAEEAKPKEEVAPAEKAEEAKPKEEEKK